MNEEQMYQADLLAKKIMMLSRNSLLVNMRFLGNVLARLPYLQYEGTLGTDGELIYYQPMHILKRYQMGDKLVSHDYLHMIMHCIFRHNFISANIQKELWDLACDIAVEYQIASLHIQCIDNIFLNEKETAIEELKKTTPLITAEAIYASFRSGISEKDLQEYQRIFTTDDHSMWYEDQPENNSGEGEDNDTGNQDIPVTPEKNNETDENERRKEKQKYLTQIWRDLSEHIQSELQNFAKQQGCESGTMLQSLQHLNRERYDYAEFLKKFAVMGEVMKLDMDSFDYQLYAYGLQLYGNVALIEPLEYREVKRIREFVIAIDTSGSVEGELVQKFMTKTFNILKSTDSFFSRVAIWIIQCDTEIQEAVKICNEEELDQYLKTMSLKGFGGTDFRPVFTYVDTLIARKEFSNLKGMVYFTDGYGTFPENKPQYKTAFAFLRSDYEQYSSPDVPTWAIKIILEDQDIR